MPPPPLSPGRRRDVTVAGLTWVCAVVLLVAVTVVADAQPTTLPDAPPMGSRGWWVGLVLVTAQALVLLARRARPRLTLVAVALAVPIAAASGVGAATGTTSPAVLV